MNSETDLGILRQLLHREQAFFDVEEQQAKLSKTNLFDSIKKLIFETRKVFSLHLSIIEEAKTGDLLQFPDLTIPSNCTAPSFFNSAVIRPYQSIITSLLQNNDFLVSTFSNYIQANPNMEDYVVFSLFPAFFSCFWSLEEANRFIDLIIQFSDPLKTSFTRALLAHPTFFIFLSSIQSEAERLLSSDEKTAEQLLKLFESRLFLFPVSLQTLISKLGNSAEFFFESILKPILIQPSIYGLLPSYENRTFEYILDQFNMEQVKELVTKITSITSTIQMQPSEMPLTSVILANDQLIYLFKEDCEIIRIATKAELKQIATFGTYPIPYRRITSSTANSVKLYSNPLASANPNNEQELASNEENLQLPNSPNTNGAQKESITEDPFETLLRSLVIRLDVAQSEDNIISTLNSALILHAGASRLEFELRLDEFKQMKKQRNAPDDVGFYVRLLTSAYEERMKHRKATLSNSTVNDAFKVQNTQSSQAVQFLEDKKLNLLFTLWEKNAKSFKEIEERIPEFCSDSNSFVQVYEGLIENFMNFATEKKRKGISQEKSVQMIYDKIMKKVTFSQFMKYRSDLVSIDKKIHSFVSENYDYLLSQSNSEFLKAFKENPKLLGLSADHLQNACHQDSLLEIADGIDNALSSLIQVLSFQGFKEIGADMWFPMTHFLFLNVNPEHTASLGAYLKQFLLDLPDNLLPCNRSVQYNVTMAHSASSFFQDEMKKHEEEGKSS